MSGDADDWTLSLHPSDPQIAEFVLRIDVSGSGGQVTTIEYLQADGDRSSMRITPLDTP
ncbi:MAG: hypothetical protein QM748_15965 [Thauera sp.]